MPIDLDTVTALALGLALAAACGFRVFVPLLVLSMGAKAGMVPLTDGFAWMASYPAMLAFAVATVVEVVAYFVPLVDNALDTVATPAAMVAGVVAMASTAVDLDPLVKWSLAIIAGGGAAGVVQSGTALGRAASTLTTGGLGNFVLSILEFVGSVVLSILALLLPILAAAAVAILLLTIAVRMGKRLFLRRAPSGPGNGVMKE